MVDLISDTFFEENSHTVWAIRSNGGTHKRHEELKKRRARKKPRLFRFVSPFHERIVARMQL